MARSDLNKVVASSKASAPHVARVALDVAGAAQEFYEAFF
jgi:hypothetical protein